MKQYNLITFHQTDWFIGILTIAFLYSLYNCVLVFGHSVYTSPGFWLVIVSLHTDSVFIFGQKNAHTVVDICFIQETHLKRYPPWNKQFETENGWLEYDYFLLGQARPFFQVKKTVCLRVTFFGCFGFPPPTRILGCPAGT